MDVKAKLCIAAMLAVASIGAACGHPLPFLTPENLALAGAVLATTFVQDGETLDLDAVATVPAGTGKLFGAGLFGIALKDAVSGTASAFATEGVFVVAKTSALAIAVGDRLFWDPAAKVVNKTSTAQQCVGVAVEAAANPSATVKMKLGQYLPVAT
jgi:predicted RecA/RadA family phage recombinase